MISYRSSSYALTSLFVVLLFPCSGKPQEKPDDEPFLPGLAAAFKDSHGNSASRLESQLAFACGSIAPDPRLAAGEFQASWQGHLYVEERGEYRFLVHGSGEIELKIAGQVIVSRQVLRNSWAKSPPLSLSGDFQPIELSFRRTDEQSRVSVFWSGPQFGLEPIPPRFLFHAREQPVHKEFERGRLLARALRCDHCHVGEKPLPGPDLGRQAGQMSREWLIRWLSTQDREQAAEPMSPRRMPHFELSGSQAEAIADWLLANHEVAGVKREADKTKSPERAQPKERGKQRDRKRTPNETEPSAKMGERLFLSVGCLACHTWRDLGASGWQGGGDLTHIADKRPVDFFASWLADPTALNRDHRMPVFDLSDLERSSLSLFLAEQTSEKHASTRAAGGHEASGKKLVEQLRCAACHHLPGDLAKTPLLPGLSAKSNWKNSCVEAVHATNHRPSYRLHDKNIQALRTYFTHRQPNLSAMSDGRLLLAENNCFACHVREGARELIPLLAPTLSDKLAAVAKRYPDLASNIPAMTPPVLTGVGDKLIDEGLISAIARRGEPYRPYLQVRMPRYPLHNEDIQAIVHYLSDSDRVPDGGTAAASPLNGAQQDRYALAGGRLVSTDGFGCTSCHQIGRVQPPPGPINARGPSLSLPAQRLRRSWFDRWVRNPARIVPRMEMPSVQLPVIGVLDSKIDDQLAAVWHVLNVPGFEPPPPNPVRILRQLGNNPQAEPIVITDNVRLGSKTLVRPFLVGLANRHNVLFDLDSCALTLWTVGDTGRQQTKGKSWYWEPAGTTVLDTGLPRTDTTIQKGNDQYFPHRQSEQLLTEADEWQTKGPAFRLDYRLLIRSSAASERYFVERKFAPLEAEQSGHLTGFAEEISLESVPQSYQARLQVLSDKVQAKCSPDGRVIHLGDRFGSRIVLREPARARFAENGHYLLFGPAESGKARCVLHYLTEIPVDRLPELPATGETKKPEPVEIATGFLGERLPLPAEIMPTGLTWKPNGALVFCTLKGQVLEAVDTDNDGCEDRLRILTDGLPAPFGVHAGQGYVDISAKFALLRLWEWQATVPKRIETLASGWGYTRDYHDWAIGLPQNDDGDYFLGIPCQQDKRQARDARFHGNVLKLSPRPLKDQHPRIFSVQPITAGHRFPMGLALDRHGELFVTDNQGNYKPFNELNHVRPGAHFGFVNALDRDKKAPPKTPPAINIPHPWTRSVNGICFLDTPKSLRAKLGRDVFGPLEGHLIGCEYDTRRLIRMSLQRVGDTYQGAAYPLSISPHDVAKGFLGPLVSAVSPRGELYVGSIRDSGWGAGNNVGEIVRIRIDPEKLPCGIAEVRAVAEGFVLDFFQPVDPKLANQETSYAVQSYRRESTPAYGGPDLDRRREKVMNVTVSKDARQVTLRLAELRPGFVYEFRLKKLSPGTGEFHPAEAHFTLLKKILPG